MYWSTAMLVGLTMLAVLIAIGEIRKTRPQFKVEE